MRYIILAHQPACSSVLMVDGSEITIIYQYTKSLCEAFANGFRLGRKIRMLSSIELPAGDSRTLYRQRLAATQ